MWIVKSFLEHFKGDADTRIRQYLWRNNLKPRLQLVSQLYFIVDERLYEVYRWQNRCKLCLILTFNVFRISQEFPIRIQEVESGASNKWLWQRRKDLSGLKMKVSFVDNKPKIFEVSELKIYRYSWRVKQRGYNSQKFLLLVFSCKGIPKTCGNEPLHKWNHVARVAQLVEL